MPWVYILRCADGSLYVGHTSNLAARIDTHNAGHASLYTALRRPVQLVYSEQYESTTDAIRRERQLKHWSSLKKEALVAADSATLKSLSRRRRR